MFYISENKADLENYNQKVNELEGYSGATKQWAEIVKHQEKELFAIQAHLKHKEELESINYLKGWFKE
ncbi:MAG: hypothetical protein HRU12_11720 [Phaeodactylibacter sp.]|nr:hypothetical protein [Phaeodactylibacter sp.]